MTSATDGACSMIQSTTSSSPSLATSEAGCALSQVLRASLSFLRLASSILCFIAIFLFGISLLAQATLMFLCSLTTIAKKNSSRARCNRRRARWHL
eukprot:CAMPEP_0172088516 /NCGR_PEP_ID=MMETSP1043-20130122/23276_1 /TAXON_ID=464988 /ORGANISM="Hemiselmis andersenii, Strain CCMP441" /LENGTH=95 /DNA_ID=CAMNT_0012750827 /DNA_START=169 /DNA_END=456 /DNA_ORIENTATION=-